ncbi:MAG: hypothetical protein HZB46_06795 [Solirubrobacterales bacterium]|nr:hypothetical protein [Solirubrobacterales bacterium]
MAALLAVLALPAGPAGSQEPTDTTPLNPCDDAALRLKCPDLTMAPPSHLRVKKAGRVLRLQAENRIVNIGRGPLEVRAHRGDSSIYAEAYQAIHRTGGGVTFFPEAGLVYWKAIPGQGHYWKYWRAARFELWTLNADGTRDRLQRTGPKLSYCFRDLDRVRGGRDVPRGRVYPACSQSAKRRDMKLGTSVGWADVYPETYHENWISITGLRGCFAFVHRADPEGELIEQREDNNLGVRRIRLPPVKGRVRGC